MRIAFEQRTLKAAIDSIFYNSAGIPAESYLSGIQVETIHPQEGAKAVAVRMTTTNLESRASLIAPCLVDGADKMSVLIPAENAKRYVNSVRGAVELVWKDGDSWVTLKSGSTRSKMVLMQNEFFPESPQPKEGHVELVVKAGHLLNAIGATSFCASKDPNAPIPSAIQLQASEGALTINATDSHRFATSKIPARCAGEQSCMIGVRAVEGLLAKMLGTHCDPDENVRLSISRNMLVANTSVFTVHVLADARAYPDISKVSGFLEQGKPIRLSSRALYDAMSTVHAVASSDLAVFEVSAQAVKITSKSEVGESEATVEVVESEFPEDSVIVCGMNPRYTKPIITQAGELVEVRFIGARQPIVFSTNLAKYLVMPVALQEVNSE